MDKNKMLIDATHPEETRVVAVRNGRVEDFDFESASRKLLRGNIYLAKVTRVEPSLQAAFIDYGGNRHGFLAFNEIHPDYYQIPVADREALKQEEAEAEARAEAEIEERSHSRGPRRRRRNRGDRPGMGAQPSAERGSEGEAGEPNEAPYAEPNDSATFSADETAHESSGSSALRHSSSGDDVLHSEPSASEGPESAPASRTADDAGVGSESDADAAPRHEMSSAPPFVSSESGASETGEAEAEVVARRAPDEEGDDRSDDNGSDDASEADEDGNGGEASEEDQVEQVATEDDALEEVPERPRRRARQYKIQEVIKRRQIMLVQVVKEERGNKGAALTTYISLAGRYTVLMPNTARGGGISRKITQPQDRKRLKAIAEELDVPEGMGLIIRTAGAARTKQEIKRDFEYLLRLWESVREVTLSSTAPCLVYEEGNIIKRAIRDLYSKDFDQIVVAGEAAHREAQDFMEMLMPGSGGHVASYREPEPLFARYAVERQLNALFSPYVTLRSGGYIVINQTEALVSVDVNSGKSTREFSIEETALNTNLEAAEEIARQLKLRDLAGLIVVDFIDMEEKRNNRAVERRLKDALRHDRARIQVGRISHFGLLEMSRQRLRAGVLEGSTSQCPHCQGTGIIRSIESVALAVLRALEDHLLKQPTSLVASTTAEVALYILNHKRAFIVDMERRHGVVIRVEASDRMQGANYAIERFAAPVAQARTARPAVSMEWGFDRDEEAEDVDVEDVEAVEVASDEAAPKAGDDERRGRRRRRRRGRRDREGENGTSRVQEPRAGGSEGLAAANDDETDSETMEPLAGGPAGPDTEMAIAEPDDDAEGGEGEGGERDSEANGNGEKRRRGRRRGRRGGRSRRREGQEGLPETTADLDDADRHEWGIAEVARVGAEQPWHDDERRSASSIGLVGSVQAEEAQPASEGAGRTSIVETIGGGEQQQTGAFSASDEAVRLAVRVAGGEAPEAVAPAPAREEVRAEPSAAVATLEDAPAAATERHEEAVPPAPAPVEAVEAKSMPAAELPAPKWVSEITFREPEAPTTPEPRRDEEPERKPEATHTPEPVAPEPAAPKMVAAAEAPAEREPAPPMPPEDQVEEPARPARRGWWQRRFGGE